MGILSGTRTGNHFFEDREKEIKRALELRGIANYKINRIEKEPFFEVTISVEELLAPTNPCN